MPKYALHDGSRVVNVIVADTVEDAEATGYDAILTVDGVPGVGWTLVDGTWMPEQPYPSWIWQENRWQPPTAAPTSSASLVYIWDENNTEWQAVAISD